MSLSFAAGIWSDAFNFYLGWHSGTVHIYINDFIWGREDFHVSHFRITLRLQQFHGQNSIHWRLSSMCCSLHSAPYNFALHPAFALGSWENQFRMRSNKIERSISQICSYTTLLVYNFALIQFCPYSHRLAGKDVDVRQFHSQPGSSDQWIKRCIYKMAHRLNKNVRGFQSLWFSLGRRSWILICDICARSVVVLVFWTHFEMVLQFSLWAVPAAFSLAIHRRVAFRQTAATQSMLICQFSSLREP